MLAGKGVVAAGRFLARLAGKGGGGGLWSGLSSGVVSKQWAGFTLIEEMTQVSGWPSFSCSFFCG